jgi:GntR family transcriptional regulator
MKHVRRYHASRISYVNPDVHNLQAKDVRCGGIFSDDMIDIILCLLYNHSQEAGPLNLSVTSRSDVPIYLQLKNRIRDAVLKGELEPGARMPSVRTLSRELGIAIITVRRAYDDLVSEGFLSNLPAVGYDVLKIDKDAYRKTVTEDIRNRVKEIRQLAKSSGIDEETLKTLLNDKGDEQQ